MHRKCAPLLLVLALVLTGCGGQGPGSASGSSGQQGPNMSGAGSTAQVRSSVSVPASAAGTLSMPDSSVSEAGSSGESESPSDNIDSSSESEVQLDSGSPYDPRSPAAESSEDQLQPPVNDENTRSGVTVAIEDISVIPDDSRSPICVKLTIQNNGKNTFKKSAREFSATCGRDESAA